VNSKGTISVQLSQTNLEFLAARGAHSSRGGGNFGLSSVLRRNVELWCAVLASADPRKSGSLSPEHLELAIELLSKRDPWLLNVFEVERLDLLLESCPTWDEAAGYQAVDWAAFREAIALLSFIERAAVVDEAIRRSVNTKRAVQGLGPLRTPKGKSQASGRLP